MFLFFRYLYYSLFDYQSRIGWDIMGTQVSITDKKRLKKKIIIAAGSLFIMFCVPSIPLFSNYLFLSSVQLMIFCMVFSIFWLSSFSFIIPLRLKILSIQEAEIQENPSTISLYESARMFDDSKIPT